MINKRIQPKKTGILGKISRYVTIAAAGLGIGSGCVKEGYVSGGASLMIPYGENSGQTDYEPTAGLQGSVGFRTKKGFGLRASLNMSASESGSGNTENFDIMADVAGEFEAAEMGRVKVIPYVKTGNLWSISSTYIPGVADDTHTSNSAYVSIGCDLEGKIAGKAAWYAGAERVQFGIGRDPENVDSLWLWQAGLRYRF